MNSVLNFALDVKRLGLTEFGRPVATVMPTYFGACIFGMAYAAIFPSSISLKGLVFEFFYSALWLVGYLAFADYFDCARWPSVKLLARCSKARKRERADFVKHKFLWILFAFTACAVAVQLRSLWEPEGHSPRTLVETSIIMIFCYLVFRPLVTWFDRPAANNWGIAVTMLVSSAFGSGFWMLSVIGGADAIKALAIVLVSVALRHRTGKSHA